MLTVVRFDFDEIFGDDYLYFSQAELDEQAERDTDDVVRFLDLHPGDSVLDAPCGHGRISNLLATRGMRVVGVDASELFLDLARAGAGDAPVAYHPGDLRDLPVAGPFDAAVSWYSSFGYFDDAGNRAVLAEYRRVLRPGGKLVMDMHNRDEIVRRFTPAPFGLVTQVGDDIRVDTHTFDCVAGRMETDRIVVRDGQVRRSHFSVRIPAITELRVWLGDAGFSGAELFARDGEAPSVHRPRLIIVATA
jgi:SAM-dependent methyltransferase